MSKIKPAQLSDIYLGVMDDTLYGLKVIHDTQQKVFIFEDEFKPADRNAQQVLIKLANSQGVDEYEYFNYQYSDDLDTAFARWTRQGDLWLPWGMPNNGVIPV